MSDVDVVEWSPHGASLQRKADCAALALRNAEELKVRRKKGVHRPFEQGWKKHVSKKMAIPHVMIPVALTEVRQFATEDCRHCAGKGVTPAILKFFNKPGVRKLGGSKIRENDHITCSCSLYTFLQINAVRLHREPGLGRLFWTHKLLA